MLCRIEMPYYEFKCRVHGKFDIFRPMGKSSEIANCPHCGEVGIRLFSSPNIKIVNKPRLQFGSGSPGKIITRTETGGLDIYIPSLGAMEQDEVDYIAEGAKEKEINRVKKGRKQGPRSEKQARIQAYTALAHRTPKGKRAKVLREAIKETGDNLVKEG